MLLFFGEFMKKFFSLLLIIALMLSFASCSLEKAEEETTDEATDIPTYESITEMTSSQMVTNDKPSETTSTVVTSATETTAEATEKSGVVTYYSDNPNNKYIRAVSEKYSVDSSCLIAFIKVNGKFPGATVLQFDGSKDSSGKMICSETTLKYVYDVPDRGAIKKASGQKTDNDGYRYAESYINFNLAVKYLVPQIEDMKSQRRYEDYFAN